MLQFSSLTITSTGSLKVPNGLVIRVTGNVSIAGPITVGPVFLSGLFFAGGCSQLFSFGAGYMGLNPLKARTLLKPFTEGGQGGGGSLTILAPGSIVIASSVSISAPGLPGRPAI